MTGSKAKATIADLKRAIYRTWMIFEDYNRVFQIINRLRDYDGSPLPHFTIEQIQQIVAEYVEELE